MLVTGASYLDLIFENCNFISDTYIGKRDGNLNFSNIMFQSYRVGLASMLLTISCSTQLSMKFILLIKIKCQQKC